MDLGRNEFTMKGFRKKSKTSRKKMIEERL